MSLIDEALKRAQEASQREGEKAQQRPWTPPPLPDAGLARRRAAVRLGLRILGAAAGVVVLVFLGRLVWDAAAPARRLRRPAAPPRFPLRLRFRRFPRPWCPRPMRRRPPSRPPGLRRLPVPRKSRFLRVEDVSPGVIEVPPPASTLDAGRTYLRVLNLPDGRRIELGGIVWSEEEPRALLNDRIVATDAYVEGFTVAKIEENRVALEKDGITIYLVLK